MSKQIKQMEMDALKAIFQDVRDLVVLSIQGITSQADNQLRQTLRKKKIYLRQVKNSLTRRVFDELGMKVAGSWEGPTTLAWGAGSLAELSRELDTLLKKNDKVKFKGAVAEGQAVTFKQALAMPTRAEAIGRVLMLALSPARRVASLIQAPAARVAAQIKTLSEKSEGEAPAPPAG